MADHLNFRQVPDEVAQAIGRSAIAFSHLEYSLLCLFEGLCNSKDDPYVGEVVFDHFYSFLGRLNLVRSLFKRKYGEAKASEYEKLFNRAEKANSKRNDLIHSYWLPTEEDGRAERYRRKGRTFETPKDILGAADKFEAASKLMLVVAYQVERGNDPPELSELEKSIT